MASLPGMLGGSSGEQRAVDAVTSRAIMDTVIFIFGRQEG